jgi:hypothetical protein
MANIVPIQPKDTLNATRDAVVNRQFAELNQDIIQHKGSTKAHDAAAIKYEGVVVGATDTKEAIDIVQAQINTLVVSGDSSPAAAQAAVDADGYDYENLKLRLDTEHTALSEQLADMMNYLNYMPINGGEFDGNDPVGPTIDGGTY